MTFAEAVAIFQEQTTDTIDTFMDMSVEDLLDVLFGLHGQVNDDASRRILVRVEARFRAFFGGSWDRNVLVDQFTNMLNRQDLRSGGVTTWL